MDKIRETIRTIREYLSTITEILVSLWREGDDIAL